MSFRSITQRERAVLWGLACGLQSKDIAEQERVSVSAIEACVRSLYEKLESRTRAQLVMRGIASGIIPATDDVFETSRVR